MKKSFIIGLLLAYSVGATAASSLETACQARVGNSWNSEDGPFNPSKDFYPVTDDLLSNKRIHMGTSADVKALKDWLKTTWVKTYLQPQKPEGETRPALVSVTLTSAERVFHVNKYDKNKYDSVSLRCTYRYKNGEGNVLNHTFEVDIPKTSACSSALCPTKWQQAKNEWHASPSATTA